MRAQHRAAEPPRADGVVDDAHFESRTGFAYQDFGDGASDAVVADDVVLHVDRPHGPLERGDQRRKALLPLWSSSTLLWRVMRVPHPVR